MTKYPETSAAQMHDWLKDHYPDFSAVNSKTVFNFVCWVRQKYHLQKVVVQRNYAMVAESANGAQAQADFGEYNLRNSQGRNYHPLHYRIVDTGTSSGVWLSERYLGYNGV